MQERLRFGADWNGESVLSADSGLEPVYSTELGVLFEGDCVHVLQSVQPASVDTVFADPPFNLGVEYGQRANDSRSAEGYISWCREWIDECIRVLKPGGAFFVYNLPKWNVLLGAYLTEQGLLFRHWIAINIKFGLPIGGRLYPSHYSLLYFTKGRPKTFRSIRTPIETCRHCGKEIKDYGGHRNAMNPKGVNLTDVWNDIPPVRHWKFKSKKRKTNQLSTKLLRRVVELSTHPGDVVLDPFGGAGTTFDVCEHTRRHWVGIELEHDNVEVIIERVETASIEHHASNDFVEGSH